LAAEKKRRVSKLHREKRKGLSNKEGNSDRQQGGEIGPREQKDPVLHQALGEKKWLARSRSHRADSSWGGWKKKGDEFR